MQSPSLSITGVGIAPFVCSSLAALDTNTAEATTGRLSRHSKSQTRHRISGERRSVEIPSPVPVERLTIRRDKQRSNRYPSHPPPKLSSASTLASASAYSSTIPPLRGLKVNRSPPTTPYPPIEVPSTASSDHSQGTLHSPSAFVKGTTCRRGGRLRLLAQSEPRSKSE